MRPVITIGACALGLATAIAGCGGETSSSGPDAGVGGVVAAPINLADCEDWQQADADERLGTIEQIRNFTGGEVAGTESGGVVLEDDRAYELFESYCQNEFARGFKLYKLYGRAAAFDGE